MSCSQAQLVLLIEYIERQVEQELRKQGVPGEKRERILERIERVKQNIIEYGIEEIQRELGI